MIKYKFDEDKIIQELKSYIDATYTEHYGGGKYQATDFIIECGDGPGFARGNILKYAFRYGKKNGKDRRDILKILHYAIIMLHIHDQSENKITITVGDN